MTEPDPGGAPPPEPPPPQGGLGILFLAAALALAMLLTLVGVVGYFALSRHPGDAPGLSPRSGDVDFPRLVD
jgi:hypothetical protein